MATPVRKKPKKAKKKRNFKGIIAFLIVIVLITLTVLSFTVFFPISQITVTGESIYSEASILRSSGVELGDNLFMQFINSSRDDILFRLPYIKSVKYAFSLPGTLIMKISPYKAAYQISVSDDVVLVADDLTTLEIKKELEEDLPVIKVSALEYKVRRKIAFKSNTYSDIFNTVISSFGEFDYPINEINMENTMDIHLIVNNTISVNVGSEANLSKKMRFVGKMLEDIPEGESGEINISSWTPENKQASYEKR